jgi:hypothetical protein
VAHVGQEVALGAVGGLGGVAGLFEGEAAGFPFGHQAADRRGHALDVVVAGAAGAGRQGLQVGEHLPQRDQGLLAGGQLVLQAAGGLVQHVEHRPELEGQLGQRRGVLGQGAGGLAVLEAAHPAEGPSQRLRGNQIISSPPDKPSTVSSRALRNSTHRLPAIMSTSKARRSTP